MIEHPSGDRHWTRRNPELIKRGTESHAAKLSQEQIGEIQAIINDRPDVNFSWLARKYGVSRITIWRHFKAFSKHQPGVSIAAPPSFQVAAHEPNVELPVPVDDDRESVSRRFWEHVDKSSGCWVWTGAIDQDGYGRVRIGRRNRKAHRVAYQLANGPFPAHLIIRHTCDNPPCCNPDHLLTGTHQDNMNDRRERGQVPSADRHWSRRRRKDVDQESST